MQNNVNDIALMDEMHQQGKYQLSLWLYRHYKGWMDPKLDLDSNSDSMKNSNSAELD